MHIWILNGPNLNLLGRREPQIYGSESFESFFEKIQKRFPETSLFYFQSNHEGVLIDKIQEIGFSADGILLNAGALTHTSLALADAVAAIETPVLEIHISNVHRRETYRQHSFLAEKTVGQIVGLGLDGYRLGIEWFLEQKTTTSR